MAIKTTCFWCEPNIMDRGQCNLYGHACASSQPCKGERRSCSACGKPAHRTANDKPYCVDCYRKAVAV